MDGYVTVRVAQEGEALRVWVIRAPQVRRVRLALVRVGAEKVPVGMVAACRAHWQGHRSECSWLSPRCTVNVTSM